mgnify:CR=1 FL=1
MLATFSAQAEEKAISRQLDQTSERFDVGLVPRTDVEEAQAAYDLTRVSLIVAEQDFAIDLDTRGPVTAKQKQKRKCCQGLEHRAKLGGLPAAT